MVAFKQKKFREKVIRKVRIAVDTYNRTTCFSIEKFRLFLQFKSKSSHAAVVELYKFEPYSVFICI